MKKAVRNTVVVATGIFGLWSLDFSADYRPVLAKPVQAVVGAPRTPVSVAGVARRSTRRAVYATSATQQQAQQQEQQATLLPQLFHQL